MENTPVTQQPISVTVAFALEVVFTIYISIVCLTAGVFHVVTPTAGTEGFLRVTGSIYVDVLAAFFVLKGVSYATFLQTNTETEYHATLIKKTFPDLVISAFLWSVVLLCTQPKEVAYWVNNALSPLCLSPFFDYRANNDFRGVNEGAWVVQTQMILFIIGERVYVGCKNSAKEMTRRGIQLTLLITWLIGFTHLAVALVRPNFIPAVLRSPLTNLTFFTQGIFLFLSQSIPAVSEGYQQLCNSITCAKPLYWLCMLVPLFVYLHHADRETDYPHCQHVIGGTPCLWVFDACNLRFLPLIICLFYWGLTHTRSIFGEGQPHFSEVFLEPILWIAKLHSTCPTFLIHSEFAALLIHYPLANAFPSLIENLAFPVLVLEMLLVATLCWYWHTLVGPRLPFLTPKLPKLAPLFCILTPDNSVELRQQESDLEQEAEDLAERT